MRKRITLKLPVNDKQRASLIREASSLIVKARELNRTSCLSRLTIVASALYEAARRLSVRVTKSNVARAAGVTELTVRNRVKHFFDVPTTLNRFLR